MITDTNNYIDQWFINIDIKKMPVSFYVIRRSLLRAVNELKPKLHGTVLDLACGVMPYKQYLIGANSTIEKYIGVDLEPTEYHNQVKPDFYWDGRTIPMEDASVDFVIATEFLEHYFDTAHIVKEIKRVLKPGGIFFFTVPGLWPVHEAPYDYHRFTPFTLQEHFNNTGYSSCIIKPLGGAHYHFALSLALWNDFKLSKKKQTIIKPFLRRIIPSLLKKDYADEHFGNGQLYSGLYGFVTN